MNKYRVMLLSLITVVSIEACQEPAVGAKNIKVGVAHDIGYRSDMEDRSVSITDQENDRSFYAIFDGHNGDYVAKALAGQTNVWQDDASHLTLHKLIFEKLDQEPERDRKGILTDAFQEIDLKIRNFLCVDELCLNDSGAVAVALLIENMSSHPMAHVAWVGDSRALFLDHNNEIKHTTEDHDIFEQNERCRITNVGCKIKGLHIFTPDGSRGLNLSRAFGDVDFKRFNKNGHDNAITATPSCFSVDLQRDNIQHILLACDGIFEGLLRSFKSDAEQNEGVVKEFREQHKKSTNPEDLARALVQFAKDSGSRDNLSAMVLKISPNNAELLK